MGKRGTKPIEENEDLLLRVARVLQHNHANHSDKLTCAEYGISMRTLQRYKEAFRTREKVANFVALQRKALGEKVYAKATEAFVALADKFIRVSLSDDLSPEMMREANEALKTIGQFITLDKAIEGRLGGVDVFGNGSSSSLPAPHSVDAELVVDESESDPSTEADAPADEGP